MIEVFQSNRLPGKKGVALGLAALLAVSALILSYELTEPWVGHHDFNGAFYSIAAKNHLTYGVGQTRFAIVLNADRVLDGHFSFYSHHPPLLSLLVATSFLVFGIHEWAARLVPIAFSLGSLFLVYVIGRDLRDSALGLLGAFLFSTTPMNAYFGRMVDGEAIANFFALAAVIAYVRWSRTHRDFWMGLSVLLLVIGMAADWPAYYLAALLPLHHLTAAGLKASNRRILAYPLSALAMLGIHLLHMSTISGTDAVLDLWHSLLHRMSSSATDFGGTAVHFTPGEFFSLWMVRANLLFTLPVLLLSIIMLWDLARGRARDVFSDPHLPLTLLAFGLANLVVLPQGAYVHDFWAFYCTAPLALLAAGGLLSLAPPARHLRVCLLILALFLASALPKTVELHRRDDSTFWVQGLWLRSHTQSGETIVTNDPSQSFPLTRYYAQRDVYPVPVATVSDLLAAKRQLVGQAAFVLSREGPGAQQLESLLSANCPHRGDLSLRYKHLVVFGSLGAEGACP